MKRAAVSVASNIAEGAGRESDKEFIQFLYYSLGSISELETQLIVANELGFIDISFEINEHLRIVRKLTIGLIKYLKSKRKK
jgi:four helix bundle protein